MSSDDPVTCPKPFAVSAVRGDLRLGEHRSAGASMTSPNHLRPAALTEGTRL
jgi:hypothetical protein